MTLPVYTDLDSLGRPTAAGTLSTAWGDAVDDDVANLHGEAAWTTPTFTNGWLDFATGTDPVGYRKVGDLVLLRGLVKSGTVGTTIFTLPVGYRPLNTKFFAVVSNNLFGYVSVSNAGVVILQGGSNVYASLDGIEITTT